MPESEPDEAAYAMVRLWIETGAYHYDYWKNTGKWPETKPTTAELVTNVLQYITPDVLPLTPEESAQVAQYAQQNPKFEGQLPPSLRRGDVVFRSRAHLVEGLNTLAPATAAKIKAKAPDADGWGLEPWAVALTASGVLYVVGKLNWKGAVISAVAGYLLLGVTAYFAVTAKTEDGKNVVRAAFDAAAAAVQEVGKKASMLVTGLIIAGTVAVGVGLTVAIVRSTRRRPLALERGRSRYVELDEESTA